MKFLKRHSSNKRMLTGKGVIYDQYENINIESLGSMQVPKGTTAQSHDLPVVGQLRYNTLKFMKTYPVVVLCGNHLD